MRFSLRRPAIFLIITLLILFNSLLVSGQGINSKSRNAGGLSYNSWPAGFADYGNYCICFENIGEFPGFEMNSEYQGAIQYPAPDTPNTLENHLLYFGETLYGNENIVVHTPAWVYCYDGYPAISGDDQIDGDEDSFIKTLSSQESISQQDKLCGFHDQKYGGPNHLNVGCTWRVMQWNTSEYGDFTINNYKFYNYGDSTTDPFYLYLFFDWDVYYNQYNNNGIEYFDSLWASRIYNIDSDVSAGIRFLSHQPVTMANNEYGDCVNDYPDIPTYINDCWLNGEKTTNSTPGDYRLGCCVGPIQLAPGETEDVYWSIVFGLTRSEWIENNNNLTTLYNQGSIIQDTTPPKSPRVVAESIDGNIYLKWTRNRIEKPFFEYERTSESSIDPDFNFKDWAGYRIYQNITGKGNVEQWSLVKQLSKQEVYGLWGQIPEIDLDPRYWAQTYWGEYTIPAKDLNPGFTYYYSVVVYDEKGNTSHPEENAIAVEVKGPASSNPDNILITPNPFKQTNLSPGSYNGILFNNLPSVCTISIYSPDGTLVKKINHTDGSGTETWNLKNPEGKKISSGIYLYHITAPGFSKKGKIAIVK